jgi:hypothetical protein
MINDVYNNYILDPLKLNFNKSELQNLDIEKTQGQHNFTIPNLSPFDTMNFLAHRAISNDDAVSKGAFFTFYDTVKNGFKFNSLETLIQKKDYNYFTYVYSPTNIPNAKGYDKIAFESKVIKDFARISPIDVEENLKNGMYANRLITHNIMRMRYDIHDLYYKKPVENTKMATRDKNTGAVIQPDAIIKANVFANNSFSIFNNDYIEKLDNTRHLSIHPVISLNCDALGSPESNISLLPTNDKCRTLFNDINKEGIPSDSLLRESNIENWYSQRKMQNRLLQSFIYQLVVPGNSHRTVGDVINVEIPSSSLEAMASNNRTEYQSNALISGLFLVTRVSHIFTNEQSHIDYNLNLHVMKDSLSRLLSVPPVPVRYKNVRTPTAKVAVAG